ncbi:MAG: DUF2269 family protein [Actinomycetota bacterium]
MNAYEIYKFVHILSAMAWFGTGVALHILLLRSRSSRDARLMASLSQASVTMGRILFTPLSLLTLLSGILMVIESPGIRFGDAWILIGFGGIVLSAVLGMSVLGPAGRRLAELAQARGTVDAEVMAASTKGVIAARVDIVALAFVVWAMVAKPLF